MCDRTEKTIWVSCAKPAVFEQLLCRVRESIPHLPWPMPCSKWAQQGKTPAPNPTEASWLTWPVLDYHAVICNLSTSGAWSSHGRCFSRAPALESCALRILEHVCLLVCFFSIVVWSCLSTIRLHSRLQGPYSKRSCPGQTYRASPYTWTADAAL